MDKKGHMEYIALHITCIRGYDQIVDHLVKHKTQLNVLDSHGRTALSLAEETGWDKVVRQLRVNDARPQLEDSHAKATSLGEFVGLCL